MILHTYSLSPESVRKYLRQTLLRFQVIVTLSVLLFGLYLALFASPLNLPAALGIAAVTGLAYFFLIFFHYRQQVRLLYSVRIELDGSGIIYRDRGSEPFRISRADVTRAQQRKDGLYLETVDPRISLLVPAGLARDGDEVVLAAVRRWTLVEPLYQPPGGRHRYVRYLVYTAAFVVLLFANSFWVILPLAAAVFAYGAYVESRLARAYQQMPGVQHMYSIAFSFLFFIILMKSCFLLFVSYLVR